MPLIQRTGNIYEQQALNRQLTGLLITLFLLYFAIIGYGTDLFLFDTDALGLVAPRMIGFPFVTAISILLAGAYARYSFLQGDQLILRSVNLDRVWEEVSKEELTTHVGLEENPNPRLVNVVHEMSIAAGIPMPDIYVIRDRDPNAFATGRDPFHASVAVTSGLLKVCTREELQAVVAHEIAHIRNYDTRLMMTLATLTGASLLVATLAQVRGLSSATRLRIVGGAPFFFFIWLGMVVLTPLFTRLVSMAITRQREYQADVEGALLTRNPVGLVKALEKIEDSPAQTRAISIAISHLCITDPMGKYLQVGEESIFRRWFPTHPKTGRRIAALREMAFIIGSKSAPTIETKDETLGEGFS